MRTSPDSTTRPRRSTLTESAKSRTKRRSWRPRSARATRCRGRPVHEALGRLELEGFLERIPRGYRVRTATDEEILDLDSLRTVLESHLAGLAAVRRSEVDLARLRQLTELLAGEPEEKPRRTQRREFHIAVRIAAHDRYSAEALERVLSLCQLYDHRFQGLIEDHDVTVAEHQSLLQAIETRDSDAAARIMAQHLNRNRERRVLLLAT